MWLVLGKTYDTGYDGELVEEVSVLAKFENKEDAEKMASETDGYTKDIDGEEVYVDECEVADEEDDDEDDEMTVGKLKELLKDIPDNAYVFVDDGCNLSVSDVQLGGYGNVYIVAG